MSDQNWNLGQVKFFDNNKGFGFVKNVINQQDYYINISNVETLPVQDNDKVVFQLAPSRRRIGTLEATSLFLLSHFNLDTGFLINQYFNLIDPVYKKAILKVLPIHCVSYIAEQALSAITELANSDDINSYGEKIWLEQWHAKQQ